MTVQKLSIVVFMLVSGFGFAQTYTDSQEYVEERSITGDNLIISWTLGNIVETYGGFDKEESASNSRQTHFAISSMRKANVAQLVKIFPNPTSNFIVVHLKQVAAREILLQNNDGLILMKKALPTSTKSYELDLTEYDDGVYFLTIITDQSVTLDRFRVIKSSDKE